MLEAKPLARALSWENWQERLSFILIVGYQALALVAFIVIPILAFNWSRTPFLGAFLGPNLEFQSLAAPPGEHWAARQLGLGFGDHLVTAGEQPVSSAAQLSQVLQGYRAGDRLPVTVRRGAAGERAYDLSLSTFTAADQFAYLYIPFFLGLVYLGCSLWVFRLRRRDASGRAFAMFATSSALALGASFDLFTTHRLVPLWTLAVSLVGGSLFHLALVFPTEARLAARLPFIRWLGYLPPLALAALALLALADPSRGRQFGPAWQWEFAYLGVAAVFFLGWTAYRRLTSPSPIARTQARILLWGTGFSFGPLAIWGLISIVRPGVAYVPYLLLPLAVFPLGAGYAVLRYRLLNTDYVVSRAVMYALLTILTAAGYGLLVAGASLLLNLPLAASNPLLVGILVLVVALFLNPVRERLQNLVDGVFFRGQSAYQERLQDFSQQLTQAMDVAGINQILRATIQGTLIPTQVHIFTHDSLSNQYLAAADKSGQLTSDLRFPATSALAQTLMRRGSAYFFGQSDTMPRLLQDEWARMSLLGAEIFIPMPGQQILIGWIALGPRRSGEPYSARDLAYLEALGVQAALAVERAQVVADLERRVHQMNVLTRIAQGINITTAFDDILELLYAQTNQVLPTQDFVITLFSEKTQTLSHAFFLEKNERLSERENQPLDEREGLAWEVIQTGTAVITDDYTRECRQRALFPVIQGVYGWISVPLNTSDATIGALGLGSRDPAVIYTDEQREILQAIADQAAGAIAKAQLLQETERRARQLATLNEVARSLVSTLELEPLLERILQSAVEILDCEAGSLFMIDPGSGDLVFEVAIGPVASELVGMRLPPGTGLVGKVADSGLPIIANDVQQDQDWSQETDQQTGFVTRAMLVVPLRVKDATIGIIEVINKRDGSPFSEDEQELLTVFSGQAAVAIENARLYTLTDQALAARVEELSVMQRIDRELNASLDIGRAMDITLEWATRQSQSEAGLVGLLEDQTLRVMGSQGYPNLLDGGQHTLDTSQLAVVQSAIQSGNAQVIAVREAESQATLLPEAQSQVAVPIRREAVVIGLLLLESPSPGHYSEETVRFLTRLSDHAAIALSNAQLYAEVQSANLAKSDFVSFVSHELKTPMTSIKGYADLLAQGAVGPINDAQGNFLTTIRSNVNRMATLVSDLADISRIEAGRLRLEFQAVSAAEVIEEVINSTQAQFEEKNQTLMVDIPADLPQVWGDRTRLIQVLTNLVSNAHKYTAEGGEIFIQAEAKANVWDPEGAARVVHILVQDNGIGINPADQKKIFQKFFRSEDERAREAPGTGLGLNITKNLVEMQGGRIWFESVYRQGTTFHFTTPLVETSE